ncbi:MAG: hypothetical protein E7037_00650 [Verrucomicrobia bacterium]|nr:hypothetical protein [Verrucomicrobiota bacterium]
MFTLFCGFYTWLRLLAENRKTVGNHSRRCSRSRIGNISPTQTEKITSSKAQHSARAIPAKQFEEP